MQRTRVGAVLILVLGLWPNSTAHAQQNCNRPTNDFDGLYCLNKVYLQADADLNAVYGKLRAALPVSARATLKTTQLAWIAQRNSRCSRRDASGFDVNLDCAADMTIARTNFLTDRYRECRSSGCQPDRLR